MGRSVGWLVGAGGPSGAGAGEAASVCVSITTEANLGDGYFDAARFLKLGDQHMGVEDAAERQQLHEQTAVGNLRLALARSAFFTKIEFFHNLLVSHQLQELLDLRLLQVRFRYHSGGDLEAPLRSGAAQFIAQ